MMMHTNSHTQGENNITCAITAADQLKYTLKRMFSIYCCSAWFFKVIFLVCLQMRISTSRWLMTLYLADFKHLVISSHHFAFRRHKHNSAKNT